MPVLQPIVLEMRVTSQVMYVSPSIEQARAHLLDQLFAWQSIITNQPRISSTRFQVKLMCFRRLFFMPRWLLISKYNKIGHEKMRRKIRARIAEIF